MKMVAVMVGVALLAASYALVTEPRAADEVAPETVQAAAPSERPSFSSLYAEVAAGDEDPLSIPMTDGIVWYGTWEDAMAEKERTGKPVALHFGSPRCPTNGVNVPGTW